MFILHFYIGDSVTRPAIYLQDAHAISEGISFSKYAEERNFDAVWQADSRLVREASVPMAVLRHVLKKSRLVPELSMFGQEIQLVSRQCSRLLMILLRAEFCVVWARWDPLATKVGVSRVPTTESHA